MSDFPRNKFHAFKALLEGSHEFSSNLELEENLIYTLANNYARVRLLLNVMQIF